MISHLAGLVVADDSTPTPTAAAAEGDWFSQNFLTIGMFVVLAILVFFMWRNSRKRRAEAEKLTQTMVPGVEVMTNFGLFGKIDSLDSTANTAELEIAPGVVIKVHRQTLVRVVDPAVPGEPGAPRSVEEAMAIAEQEQQEREAAANGGAASTVEDEPKYGERIPEAGADADKADGDSTAKN